MAAAAQSAENVISGVVNDVNQSAQHQRERGVKRDVVMARASRGNSGAYLGTHGGARRGAIIWRSRMGIARANSGALLVSRSCKTRRSAAAFCCAAQRGASA